MDEKRPKSEIQRDYEDFLATPPLAPPETIQGRITQFVYAKLHPSLWLVLSKITGIYTVVGFLVLLVCPQFGLTVAAEHGILHWFSLMGPYPCMAACGALFLGSGAIVTMFTLSPEEIRRIRPLRFVYFVAFGLLALAIFIALGAKIILGLGLAWLTGSVIAELAAFELGWKLRLASKPQLLS